MLLQCFWLQYCCSSFKNCFWNKEGARHLFVQPWFVTNWFYIYKKLKYNKKIILFILKTIYSKTIESQNNCNYVLSFFHSIIRISFPFASNFAHTIKSCKRNMHVKVKWSLKVTTSSHGHKQRVVWSLFSTVTPLQVFILL